jgi:nitrite reductase/ring-hydroxylating ferredoxin subunit
MAGMVLCRLDDIPDGEGKGLTVDTRGGEREIMIVRKGGDAYGYLNSCPHAWVQLDWSPDRFMNRDKTHIMCATHGAMFEIETGRCVAGPCLGDKLMPFPVKVVNGNVVTDLD